MWWQFPPLGNISYAGQAEQSDWTSQNCFQPICAVFKTSKEEHRFKPIYAVAKKPVKLNNMFDLLREPIDDIEDKDVNIVEDKFEDKAKKRQRLATLKACQTVMTNKIKCCGNKGECILKSLEGQRLAGFHASYKHMKNNRKCCEQIYGLENHIQ